MAAQATIEAIAGSERTHAERLAVQWPHLNCNLFPEGEDCYGDPARAAFVKASYEDLDAAVREARAGDPMLLIGRRAEPAWSGGGLGRTLALGEMAGNGAGLLLDYREGQIVFPTTRHATLVRRKLTGINNHERPTVQEGPLESGEILKNEGLLKPKDDIVDNPLYTSLNGDTPRRLRSVEEEEMWGHTAEIAIGQEAVAALMESTLAANSSRTAKIYGHDFDTLLASLQ